MSSKEQLPAPAAVQATGLYNEHLTVSSETISQEIILAKLDKFYESRVCHGPSAPEWLACELANYLTPDELMVLIRNPNNVGISIPYKNQGNEKVPDTNREENLVRMAAWRQATYHFDAAIEDYLHYFHIRHYGNKAVVAHISDNNEFVHQTIPAFKHSYIDKFVADCDPKTGELKRTPMIDKWLKSPLVKRYDSVRFLPDMVAPPHIFNLWRGWPCRDIPDDSAAEPIYCELFLTHLLENVCGNDVEVYHYLLGWMADAVQNPHRTSRIALVLRGPQGSGKSLFATCFAELFEPHSAILARPEQLTGQFNKHLMDKCLVFADEAFFAGNRQQAAALKTMVTSEELFVEPKGVDGFMAPKLFRLIMASNDEHVIRAESDDRRFLVLNVDARENNNSSEYFGAIINEWNNGGKQALFRWLRGGYWRDVLECDWRPEDRPKTRALELQKDLSLDAPDMAVLNMLREGEPPCLFVPVGDGIFVPTQEMADAVRLGIKELKSLGTALRVIAKRDHAGKPMGVRYTIDRQQRRGFVLPKLADARQQWEQNCGWKIDWPEEVEDWGLCNDTSYTHNGTDPF